MVAGLVWDACVIGLCLTETYLCNACWCFSYGDITYASMEANLEGSCNKYMGAIGIENPVLMHLWRMDNSLMLPPPQYISQCKLYGQ